MGLMEEDPEWSRKLLDAGQTWIDQTQVKPPMTQFLPGMGECRLNGTHTSDLIGGPQASENNWDANLYFN